MLVVVHVRFLQRLVLVPEPENRGNPKSQHHAHQQQNRDRCDPQRELVRDHDQLSALYFSRRTRFPEANAPKANGPQKASRVCLSLSCALSYWCAAGLSPGCGAIGVIACAVSSITCGSGRSSATFSTWSMVSTKCIFISLRRFSGTSARSFSLSWGRITSKSPARCAASSFSFNPPMGSTLPRSVISPVIARSRRTGILLSALAIAVAIVIPADGPSFGIAPSGTCT